MKALSPVDQLFLWLEKRQQPMHVAGLQLFSFPEDAGPKYVSELAQHMRDYCCPVAPFNQRLTRRLGQYYWTEDKHFDIDHHFRHEALPKPGRIRELLSLVSAEHSNLGVNTRSLVVRRRSSPHGAPLHHATSCRSPPQSAVSAPNETTINFE